MHIDWVENTKLRSWLCPNCKEKVSKSRLIIEHIRWLEKSSLDKIAANLNKIKYRQRKNAEPLHGKLIQNSTIDFLKENNGLCIKCLNSKPIVNSRELQKLAYVSPSEGEIEKKIYSLKELLDNNLINKSQYDKRIYPLIIESLEPDLSVDGVKVYLDAIKCFQENGLIDTNICNSISEHILNRWIEKIKESLSETEVKNYLQKLNDCKEADLIDSNMYDHISEDILNRWSDMSTDDEVNHGSLTSESLKNSNVETEYTYKHCGLKIASSEYEKVDTSNNKEKAPQKGGSSSSSTVF